MLKWDHLQNPVHYEANALPVTRPGDQDGHISIQCEEKLHSLVTQMKALLWHKNQGLWGPGARDFYYPPNPSLFDVNLKDLKHNPSWAFKMDLFFNPFDNLVCVLLGISFTVWFTMLLVFIIVPAIFGVSFGIRRLYMKTLLKIFEVSETSKLTIHKKCLDAAAL